MNVAATGVLDPVALGRRWLRDADALSDDALVGWESAIGDVPVRFRCTDPETAELYRGRLMPPGLGSDVSGLVAPALRLDLIEADAIGWELPRWVDAMTPPQVARVAAARLGLLMPAAGAAYPFIAFDPATARGVTLVRTVRDLPPWAAGSPFVLALHLAFAWRGWRLVHASTVGSGGVGALLLGPGGTGKSGTALAALAAGLGTVGDDYVLIAPGPDPVAWPIYRIAKQDPAGLHRIGRGDLAQRPVNWMGKVEIDLDAAYPGRIAPSLALRTILLPELSGDRRTRISPVTAAEAFSAAVPSNLVQLPGARTSGFRFFTRLTRSLPAYRVRLSEDPGEIAAVLRALLER